ncbi:MAG: thioesterase family protein [Chitinophagaceae bacterium]|nr:thioesterase family protein [Chitinophagaceae bacterium]
MARVQIEIPDSKPKAILKIPVRITDINYGNHLGNDSMVSIIHEARMQFLKGHGFTELKVEGTGLIMGDLAIQFKNESHYGDILTVEIFTKDITKVSFNLVYKITTARNSKTILIAIASTNIVGYNYSLKKVSPIPAVLLAIL